jgi:hypothetical protein
VHNNNCHLFIQCVKDVLFFESFESLFEKNGTEVCNAYVRDRPREKEDRACVQ